jgi:hypothetical protein
MSTPQFLKRWWVCPGPTTVGTSYCRCRRRIPEMVVGVSQFPYVRTSHPCTAGWHSLRSTLRRSALCHPDFATGPQPSSLASSTTSFVLIVSIVSERCAHRGPSTRTIPAVDRTIDPFCPLSVFRQLCFNLQCIDEADLPAASPPSVVRTIS